MAQVSSALSIAARATAMTGSRASLDMVAPETGFNTPFLRVMINSPFGYPGAFGPILNAPLYRNTGILQALLTLGPWQRFACPNAVLNGPDAQVSC
jgi:hypothetical protein